MTGETKDFIKTIEELSGIKDVAELLLCALGVAQDLYVETGDIDTYMIIEDIEEELLNY